MVLIYCHQHHSGTCDFNSYPKQQEQFVREENPCSQKEVYSNEVDGYCELLKLGAASCVVSIFQKYISGVRMSLPYSVIPCCIIIVLFINYFRKSDTVTSLLFTLIFSFLPLTLSLPHFFSFAGPLSGFVSLGKLLAS